MAALKVRRRSRLRRKEATDWTARLAAEFGMAVPADDVPIDEAEAGPHRLLLRDNEAFALLLGEDIVRVRDEKNLRPLAVGRARMDGPTMAQEEKGKAIETIHHVGDEIWRLGEEET